VEHPKKARGQRLAHQRGQMRRSISEIGFALQVVGSPIPIGGGTFVSHVGACARVAPPQGIVTPEQPGRAAGTSTTALQVFTVPTLERQLDAKTGSRADVAVQHADLRYVGRRLVDGRLGHPGGGLGVIRQVDTTHCRATADGSTMGIGAWGLGCCCGCRDADR
jgi:hypothetical protein